MRITLCGSARFEKHFKSWNKKLTLAGHVVYGLSSYPSENGGDKTWYSPEQKNTLDRVHKAKIDNSDAILVLDYDGYIGESTKGEILHALATGKTVFHVWYNTVNIDGVPHTFHRICPYDGCSDPMVNRPPCALCYE